LRQSGAESGVVIVKTSEGNCVATLAENVLQH
jgi:hypothetical protein